MQKNVFRPYDDSNIIITDTSPALVCYSNAHCKCFCSLLLSMVHFSLDFNCL